MNRRGPKVGVRTAWAMRYSLTHKQRAQLTPALMAQLSYCKTDACRRLILGKSS